MLTCHACMTRCIQTIIDDSISIPVCPTLSSRFRPRRQLRRSYSALAVQSQGLKDGTLDATRVLSGYTGYNFTNRRKPPEDRQKWLESRGVRPLHKRKPTDESFVVKKHLSYLKDPLKLADFVRKTLRDNGDFETTHKLVQAASKDIQCTVSWNHLIDYQLSKGRMNLAIKIYNEMKKRAQTPDAHTYTIIFRGCAGHKDSGQALAKVLALFQSMQTENAPIRPNTIHMNAVLKMCARAKNLESMFAIADQLPEKGLRAPNNLTFTTILNALRMNATVSYRDDLTPMQKRKNARAVLQQARQIWADVIVRWQKGDIWIDEELVASMGRLLLIGDMKDIDDIMSLIEQTMNIPRQAAAKKIKRDRENQSQPVIAAYRAIPEAAPQNHLQSSTSQSTDKASDEITHKGGYGLANSSPNNTSQPANVASDETGQAGELHFEVFKPAGPVTRSKGLGVYASPGPNTLSLLMSAALKLQLKDAAAKYWKIFTEDLKVRPDMENFHSYLRVLRLSRSSTETVAVLQSMRVEDLEPKTFRIAMSTCERDKNNHHCFANASKILDLMQTALTEPYVPAITSYLEVAITSPCYSGKLSSKGENEFSKREQGKQIIRALERLKPFVVDIRSHPLFKDETSVEKRRKSFCDSEFTTDCLELVRRLISAYDLLINGHFVPRDQDQQRNMLRKERSVLAAFVTRQKQAMSVKSDEGESRKLERAVSNGAEDARSTRLSNESRDFSEREKKKNHEERQYIAREIHSSGSVRRATGSPQ